MKILDIILYKIKDIFSRLYIIEKWKNNISIPEPSYKVYTALLNQSGENAPTATVLKNTLGGEVVWSRATQGVYRATLTGAFTENKTVILIDPMFIAFYAAEYSSNFLLYREDSDNVYLGITSDGDIHNIFIEIRVYQ